MDIAYSADYQLITTQDAVKGRRYFCPLCNGALHFYPGKRNTPHFRHGKGVPDEVKAACELYSQGVGEYSMYDQELRARQKVRLVLKKEGQDYMFQLNFPLIKQFNVNMQLQNLYYTYYCEQIPDFEFNTIRLLPARAASEHEVPLLGKYRLYCSNERYEKIVGLQISGDFEPFIAGPLIFKEIQGQYISIPYRRITLSGKFFVVSLRPLISIHSDVEIVSQERYEEFHIYELIMPIAFSDELQKWFTRILYYTLLAATCHLDLCSPVSFKKIGTIIEVNSFRSTWLLTNIGERPIEQRIIMIEPSKNRQVFKIQSDQKIDITLRAPGDYLLYVDQEVSDFITVRYNPSLIYNRNFSGEAIFDNKDILFKINQLHAEQIELQTNLSIAIQTKSDINYEIKYGGKNTFNAPIRIDFPTLWSINVKEPSALLNSIAFEEILKLYENNHLYPKVICLIDDVLFLNNTVMNSTYVYKDKILYYIRRLGIRMPKPIVEIIKEMKLIQ